MPSAKSLSNRNLLIEFIDGIAYCLILILIVNYSAFMSDFAERNIFIKPLHLPVFIGEFFLISLSILAFIKCQLLDIRLKDIHPLFYCFALFILIKAFVGYLRWDVLAFRTAAMFYYFFYAALTYFFYNQSLLSRRTVGVGIGVLLFVMPKFRWSLDYYDIVYFFLGFAYIFTFFRSPKIKLLASVVFLVMFPIRNLFEIGRGALISNFVALVFLIFSFTIPTRLSWRIKVALILSSLLLVSAIGFRVMSDSTRIRNFTLFQIPLIVQRYQEFIEKSNHSIRRGDGPGNLKVLLYEKNLPVEFMLRRNEDLDAYQPLYFYRPTDLDEMIREGKSVESGAISHDEYLSPFNKIGYNANMVSSVPMAGTGISKVSFQGAGTAAWRILLWRDMMIEYWAKGKNPFNLLFGIDFGKPLRSVTLETSNAGVPVITGWFEPHNSFLHFLYSGGIVGVFFFTMILHSIWRLWKVVIKAKLFPGIFLLAILVYWLFFSLTFVIIELPYFAIVFWVIAGLSAAYIFTATKFSVANPKKV